MADPRSRAPSERLRIVVLGYVVRGPIAGMAAMTLQYVRGLADLGHEVYFLEDSDDYPSCFDPVHDTTTTDPAVGLAWAERAFAALGLGSRWAYFDAHRDRWHGPVGPDAVALCARADLLLDVAGMNPVRPWLGTIPVRVLIDTDPGFTQVRNLDDANAAERSRDHNVFATFAANVGRADCGVPDDGFPWQPTRPPVVLDLWPVAPGRPEAAFTTVMLWDSYPSREHAGVRLGCKSDSFPAILDLPGRTSQRLEVAVGGPKVPRDRLRAHGWRLRDPRPVGADLGTYREYLASSKGELSVAKAGYVVTGSGWFSERSVDYLALGRPVVVQDTGFSHWLDTGRGVVAFTDADEALAGLEAISARYDEHCRAAHEVARSYFAADVVLTELIDRAMAEGTAR